MRGRIFTVGRIIKMTLQKCSRPCHFLAMSGISQMYRRVAIRRMIYERRMPVTRAQ